MPRGIRLAHGQSLDEATVSHIFLLAVVAGWGVVGGQCGCGWPSPLAERGRHPYYAAGDGAAGAATAAGGATAAASVAAAGASHGTGAANGRQHSMPPAARAMTAEAATEEAEAETAVCGPAPVEYGLAFELFGVLALDTDKDTLDRSKSVWGVEKGPEGTHPSGPQMLHQQQQQQRPVPACVSAPHALHEEQQKQQQQQQQQCSHFACSHALQRPPHRAAHGSEPGPLRTEPDATSKARGPCVHGGAPAGSAGAVVTEPPGVSRQHPECQSQENGSFLFQEFQRVRQSC